MTTSRPTWTERALRRLVRLLPAQFRIRLQRRDRGRSRGAAPGRRRVGLAAAGDSEPRGRGRARALVGLGLGSAAGREVRVSHDAAHAGVHRDGRAHARARHRRERGPLQRDRRGDAAHAVRQTRTHRPSCRPWTASASRPRCRPRRFDALAAAPGPFQSVSAVWGGTHIFTGTGGSAEASTSSVCRRDVRRARHAAVVGRAVQRRRGSARARRRRWSRATICGRLLGGTPSVVGSTVTVNQTPVTIVGRDVREICRPAIAIGRRRVAALSTSRRRRRGHRVRLAAGDQRLRARAATA